MKEITKNILKKWGTKLKKNIEKLDGSKLSLDPLDNFILTGDFDGAIAELQRLRKMRKKMKKDR
jgi:hypothetical protein